MTFNPFDGLTTNEPIDRPGTAHNQVIDGEGKTRSTTWQNADRWQRRLTRLDVPESLEELAFDGLAWVTAMALVLQISRFVMLTTLASSGLAWLGSGVIVTALIALVHWYAFSRFGSRACVYRSILTALAFAFVLL